MPVTEFKEENLPKGLRKKKIKEIRYRRKYGKMAIIPVLIFFLLFSGLAAASGLAHCSTVTLSNADSAIMDIWVNGTDGINTDVWVMNSSDSGFNMYHYNNTGRISMGSPWNCTASHADGNNPYDFFMNGSHAWVMRYHGEFYIYNQTCVNKSYIWIDIGSTTYACATTNTSMITKIWIANLSGTIYKYNISDLAPTLDTNCTVPGITTCNSLDISSDGKILYVDNTETDGCIYLVDETCTAIATWNVSTIVAGAKNKGVVTTDGEYFWAVNPHHPFKITRFANDSTAPQIRNAGNNLTYMTRNGTLGIWGTVYDDCNCTYAWIRSNETGAMVDVTGSAGNNTIGIEMTGYNITMNWSNNSHYCNQNLGLYVCAGDTSGNTNCSAIHTIYRLPYAHNTSGAAISSATCTSEYDATFTFGATGVMNHTFYFERVYRNATHSECNYDTSIGGRIEITNMTTSGMHLCCINVTPDIVTAGGTVRVHEAPPLKGAAPPNLPAALAGLVATLMIFIYSYTTRR